ncbi:MAG: hypothetical protein MRY72_10520 [Aquisalinus sp.]|nr:hypothetical protein [Aquisalinus sp.]
MSDPISQPANHQSIAVLAQAGNRLSFIEVGTNDREGVAINVTATNWSRLADIERYQLSLSASEAVVLLAVISDALEAAASHPDEDEA